MAREVAISKLVKISKAQQYMLLAVLGTGMVLGVAIALVQHFSNQIAFNAKVIAAEEEAIADYSEAIRTIGICRKPAGESYTLEELKKCNPDSIEASQVSGTLRYNILEVMAANEVLASVQKETSTDCLNPATGKNYTYAEMNERYSAAETPEALNAASELIQSCSALRIIPDALPAYKNEEALLASLNKIFLMSGWEPNSLSPTGTATEASFGKGLNRFSVRLSVEASTETTMGVLSNIERSIREFNVERATIEWASNNTLILQAQATAYYMRPSTLSETTKTVRVGSR